MNSISNIFYLEYSPVFVTLCIGLILASVIFGASYFFSRQASDPEKLSPYECGFEPFEDARNTFDIRFYFVAILFIGHVVISFTLACHTWLAFGHVEAQIDKQPYKRKPKKMFAIVG